MKKILKEPLVHFLLIGLSLFILYGLVNKDVDDEQTIVIDDFDMKNIISSWEMQWKRLPSDTELKNLVEQNIKQEIFYQEALKMNLDHNDEIIKRRLAQKMQFLSNDLATVSKPTEKDLQEYFEENVDSYMTPDSYSFYQLIISPDHRTDAKTDAMKLLESIKKRSPEEVSGLGDSMPFPFYFEKSVSDDIDRQLGNDISSQLKTASLNIWSGPLKSGFGYHLVYITEHTRPQKPEFQEIKNEVVRDLEYQNQQKMDDMIYEELRKNYQIEYLLDPQKFDESFVDYLENE